MGNHKLHPDNWIDDYSDMLLRFALVRVSNRDIAKDLVQETFYTALRGKEQFRGEVSEKNWLFLILKSRILDHYKKKKEVNASSLLSRQDGDSSDDTFNESGMWTNDGAPNEWTTDRMIQNEEFMQILADCKSNLPEAQNMVFTMKYLDGEDSETICKELDISASNYWVLVHRAKLQLRTCLEKNWMN